MWCPTKIQLEEQNLALYIKESVFKLKIGENVKHGKKNIFLICKISSKCVAKANKSPWEGIILTFFIMIIQFYVFLYK